MEQTARVGVRYEVTATVKGADGTNLELGTFGTRHFWLAAFRWNLRQGHWRAAAGNLRDLPRYLVGRG